MQVVLSIKAGKVLPSAILRRLNNHSHKNRLYQVFRELGRVIRTIFLLRYGEYEMDVNDIPPPIAEDVLTTLFERIMQPEPVPVMPQ